MTTKSDEAPGDATPESSDIPLAMRALVALVSLILALVIAGLSVGAALAILALFIEDVDGAILNVLFALSMPLSLIFGGVVGVGVYRRNTARLLISLSQFDDDEIHALSAPDSSIAVAAKTSSTRSVSS